jgi:hypothetical protein
MEVMKREDFETGDAGALSGRPLNTMLAVVPEMRERGDGRIVNISSIGGKIAVPHLVPYSAQASLRWSVCRKVCNAELRKDGVAVTTVCPGLMRTGSPRNANFKGRHREEYAWFSISDSLPVTAITRAPARPLRRHHDRDGRHHRLGDLHEPVGGRASGHTPFLILGAWVLGGLVCTRGGIHLGRARCAATGRRRPVRVPARSVSSGVAFLYGWVLLLVIQTGGMAAVAVTFALLRRVDESLPISLAYSRRSCSRADVINCLGVRAGSTVQSILMVLKIVAIAMLVVCGFLLREARTNPSAIALIDHRLTGSVDRIRRRARAGHLCLRRLANSNVRRRRDQRATQESATRIDTRRHRRRAALSRGERGLHQRAWEQQDSLHQPRRFGRDASALGDFGARASSRRHRDLDRRAFESKHADRATRLLRDGERRIVLQERRHGASTNARADRSHRTAGIARDRDRAFSELTSAFSTTSSHRRDFLWIDCVLYLRLSQTCARRNGQTRVPGHPFTTICCSSRSAGWWPSIRSIVIRKTLDRNRNHDRRIPAYWFWRSEEQQMTAAREVMGRRT